MTRRSITITDATYSKLLHCMGLLQTERMTRLTYSEVIDVVVGKYLKNLNAPNDVNNVSAYNAVIELNEVNAYKNLNAYNPPSITPPDTSNSNKETPLKETTLKGSKEIPPLEGDGTQETPRTKAKFVPTRMENPPAFIEILRQVPSWPKSAGDEISVVTYVQRLDMSFAKAEEVAAEFLAYKTSKYRDLPLAYKNWCRNEVKRNGKGSISTSEDPTAQRIKAIQDFGNAD